MKNSIYLLLFSVFFCSNISYAVPGNVTGLTCTVLSSTSISATWVAGTGSPSYYYARIDTSPTYLGDHTGSDVIYAPTVTNTFTGLTPGTTYYVHVAALDGTWAWSGSTNSSSCTPSCTSSSSDYYRSLATGNWQTAGTWQSSCDNSTWITSTLVPTSAAASVTVQTGHTVTVNGTSTSGNLTTAGTGTLTLGANLTVTGTVTSASTSTISVGAYALVISGTTTISGTLSITSGSVDANGTFDATSGAVTFAGAGNLYLGGAVTSIGTFTESTSTVTYDYAGAQTIDSDTYYHFVSAGSGAKTLAGAIIVLGNVTLSGGVLTQSTYAINVAGNWTSSGNYYSEGTGTVTFDGTSTSTVSATTSGSSTSLVSESFENAGAVPTGWSQAVITNAGTAPNLTFETSSTFPAGFSATAGSYFVRFNSYDASSTGQSRLKRTTSFSSSGYTNIVVNFDWSTDNDYAGYLDKVRVQYSTDGATWTSSGSDILRYSASGDAWSNQSVTLPVGAENQATLYIALLFTSDYGNDCYLDNVTVTGDIATTGETFNKLAFNKTGAGQIVLASNLLVNTQLTLTAGYHNLATYTLQMGSATATAPILTYTAGGLYSATDNGSFKRYIPTGAVSSTATPFYGLFPFKKTATNLNYLELNSTSNITTAGFITATPKFANTVLDITDLAVGGGGGSTVTYVKSGKMIGVALTTIAGGTISVKVSSGTFTSGTASDYTLVNWSSGVTATVLGTFVTQTASATLPVITRTGVATASLAGGITVGTFNFGATPLPIELISFKGIKSGKDNELTWTTATELNNDFFTLERTYDGSTFEIVGIMNGAGNSTQNSDYFLTDYNVRPTINYYRLKQIDFDGQFTFSDVISIDNTIIETSKEVVMKTNILGQEVNEQYRGLVVIVYSDGTSVKIIQ